MNLLLEQSILSQLATWPMLAEAGDLVIYILPVLGSMLLSYGIYQVIVESKSSSRKRVQDRLQGRKSKSEKTTVESLLRRGAVGQSETFADTIIGKLSFVPKFQTLLDQADISWSASSTLLNMVGISIAAAIGLMVMAVNPLISIGCGIAAFILPIMFFGFKKRRRVQKITNQLPDVFDMMGQALRAGQSLGGAIQNIYEQMPPPIATEFAQVYHEQNLGVKIEDALVSMANRLDSLDVRFFVTAVVIQRQTGGDLAEVLERISGVIRERIELAGLVRGLTAEGRLSGWVLFSLPVIVFTATLYLNPDYGSVLLEDPMGQMMLMVACGMQLMGIAMIRWIVNIKV